MDLPGNSDEALAQPTRARIFGALSERGAAASTEELAELLGMHPNGVRRHLKRLREAGLVEQRQQRGRRGRPGDLWLVAPGAEPGGAPPSGYAELARWLAAAIPAKTGRLRELEKAGKEIGRELAPKGSADPIEGFRQAATALGFRPAIVAKSDGGFSCRLENCPYRESVRESPDVVCSLHRGITEGLLERLDPEARLVGFQPRDPDRAGCRVEVASRRRPAPRR
jgi:predicted ArsR family transcriptional regulator